MSVLAVVSGLPGLRAAFSELSRALDGAALEQALLDAARVTVVPAANAAAPEVVRGYIDVVRRKARGKRNAAVGIGGVARGGGWLAHLFEFGTAPRMTKGARTLKSGRQVGGAVHSTGQMAARPFVRPTFRATRQAMLAIAAAKLGKQANKIRVSGTRGR